MKIVRISKLNILEGLWEDILLDKKDVNTVQYLSNVRVSIVLVAIDSYDVVLEVDRVRKNILNKLWPKFLSSF